MKKFINFLIIFLVLSVLTFYYALPTESETIEELEEKIASLQERAELLEQQIDAYRGNVQGKRNEIRSLQTEIRSIENQVSRLKTEINHSENQILLTSLEIDRLQLQIGVTEQEIKKNVSLLTEFIRILNEYDKQNLASLLLSVSSLSDFFNQQNYIETLHSQVKETLQRTKTLKTTLTEESGRQEKKKESLASFKRNLVVQKIALDQEETRKNVLLKQTKGEERYFQNLLSEVEKQQAQFVREIQRLETEVLIQKNFLQHVEAGRIPSKGTQLFIWPEDNSVLTQGYGMTSFAKRGAYGGSPHNGIDIAAGAGSPIKAAASGEILVKGYNKGWGNWVAIEHQGGIVTLYSHMIKPSHLSINTSVETGDIIGYEGSTGFVTGSHLHFSVYVNFFTFEREGNIYFNYFEGTINPLDYM